MSSTKQGYTLRVSWPSTFVPDLRYRPACCWSRKNLIAFVFKTRVRFHRQQLVPLKWTEQDPVTTIVRDRSGGIVLGVVDPRCPSNVLWCPLDTGVVGDFLAWNESGSMLLLTTETGSCQVLKPLNNDYGHWRSVYSRDFGLGERIAYCGWVMGVAATLSLELGHRISDISLCKAAVKLSLSDCIFSVSSAGFINILLIPSMQLFEGVIPTTNIFSGHITVTPRGYIFVTVLGGGNPSGELCLFFSVYRLELPTVSSGMAIRVRTVTTVELPSEYVRKFKKPGWIRFGEQRSIKSLIVGLNSPSASTILKFSLVLDTMWETFAVDSTNIGSSCHLSKVLNLDCPTTGISRQAAQPGSGDIWFVFLHDGQFCIISTDTLSLLAKGSYGFPLGSTPSWSACISPSGQCIAGVSSGCASLLVTCVPPVVQRKDLHLERTGQLVHAMCTAAHSGWPCWEFLVVLLQVHQMKPEALLDRLAGMAMTSGVLDRHEADCFRHLQWVIAGSAPYLRRWCYENYYVQLCRHLDDELTSLVTWFGSMKKHLAESSTDVTQMVTLLSQHMELSDPSAVAKVAGPFSVVTSFIFMYCASFQQRRNGPDVVEASFCQELRPLAFFVVLLARMHPQHVPFMSPLLNIVHPVGDVFACCYKVITYIANRRQEDAVRELQLFDLDAVSHCPKSSQDIRTQTVMSISSLQGLLHGYTDYAAYLHVTEYVVRCYDPIGASGLEHHGSWPSRVHDCLELTTVSVHPEQYLRQCLSCKAVTLVGTILPRGTSAMRPWTDKWNFACPCGGVWGTLRPVTSCR